MPFKFSTSVAISLSVSFSFDITPAITRLALFFWIIGRRTSYLSNALAVNRIGKSIFLKLMTGVASGTERTGQLAILITRSVVDPMKNSRNLDNPCVPITIKSIPWSLAIVLIISDGLPDRTTWVTTRSCSVLVSLASLVRFSFAMSASSPWIFPNGTPCIAWVMT